jgi:CheY-like chemotaxis protein
LGNGRTILLVDDERPVLQSVGKYLVALGYQILTAASGEEALAEFTAAENPVEAVVLDLTMPGMGGRRCLDELLQIDPNAKVLVASGYSGDGEEKAMLQAGAKAFVPKPFRLQGLADKIQATIEEGLRPS